jgi:hypothetical protein
MSAATDQDWAARAKSATNGHTDESTRKLIVTLASEMKPRAVQWLWEEGENKWLPLGELALLGGREGIGKSTAAYDLIAKITLGTLPGDMYGKPKCVIVCATEDDWESSIIPKLIACGANQTRVLKVVAVEVEGFEGSLLLPRDVERLKQLIGEYDVAFVLLDPLLSALDKALDSHKDAEVRQGLEPLSALAHSAKVSMLGLIHENKSNAADLLTRIMGSNDQNLWMLLGRVT